MASESVDVETDGEEPSPQHEAAQAQALLRYWASLRTERMKFATDQLDQARRIHKCGIEVEKIGYGKLAEGIQDAAQRAERGWACKVRRSHSHSLTRDKCTVQIHDDCLRLTAAKLGGKRELVELSAMNLLGATLQPDAFGSQSVAISVLTTPSSASSEGGVSSLELYELSDFEEPAEAAACRDAAQALGASICPLADRGGVLAIVNPTSGHKKGEEIFRRVEPLFVRAGVKLTAKFTRYGGHAADIVRGYVTNLAGTNAAARGGPIAPLDLDEFPTVVIIGGDGTVYEFLNALMERADWRDAAKRLRIGTIPAGSECALAKMIGFMHPLAAAFLLLKGHQVRSMDVLRVTQDAKVMHSICGVGWGMPGKMAAESETMRAQWGPARYLVSGLKSFVALKGCRGSLHVLPDRPPAREASSLSRCLFAQLCSVCQRGQLRCMEWMNGEGDVGAALEPLPADGWEVIDGQFILVGMLKSARAVAPFVHLSDGCVEVLALRMQSRVDLVKQSTRILERGMDAFLKDSAAAAAAAAAAGMSSPTLNFDRTSTFDRESSAGSFEGSYPPSLPSPAGSAAFAVSPTPSADPHPGAAAARPAGGEPPLYWKARAVRLIPHDAADAINVDGEVLPGRAVEVRVLPALLKVLAAYQPHPEGHR